MNRMIVAILALAFLSLNVGAAVDDAKTPSAPVKYKSGKDVNFEELLIQGQIRRPEISVITGSAEKGTDGLLRLRDNFLDRVAADQGEE